MFLFNRVNRRELKEKMLHDPVPRKTISFYRYVTINDPVTLRDLLYRDLSAMGALGRIYLAREGVNAQMNVPKEAYEHFLGYLDKIDGMAEMPIKEGVEDDGHSFSRLTIKVRKKIVADGLDDGTFDTTNVGRHLSAKEFNEAMNLPGTLVVDMRNHYETEVGRFDNAICPDADTFREELPMVLDLLKDKKENKILMYCTGGVRCEKASAYLRHHGFKDVNQLHGGIIDYARQIKAEGLSSRFRGKNFVFDERLGERITDDILSTCHQCGKPCDTHTNCANDDCHLLFIQCEECHKENEGCCSATCRHIAGLPIEEQRELRRGKLKTDSLSVYKSRLRPHLGKILAEKPAD